MSWVHRARDEHRCKQPGLWRANEGDQWQCDTCSTLWQVSGRSHPSHPRLRWVRPVDLDNLPKVSDRYPAGGPPDFDG